MVCHTEWGHVAVLDNVAQLRYDMTPDQARAAAASCEALTKALGLQRVIISILDDNHFAFCGTGEDMAGMAKNLRVSADMAEAHVSVKH